MPAKMKKRSRTRTRRPRSRRQSRHRYYAKAGRPVKPIEYYGGNSGRYSSNANNTVNRSAYGPVSSRSYGTINQNNSTGPLNLAPYPNATSMQTGGKRRRRRSRCCRRYRNQRCSADQRNNLPSQSGRGFLDTFKSYLPGDDENHEDNENRKIEDQTDKHLFPQVPNIFKPKDNDKNKKRSLFPQIPKALESLTSEPDTAAAATPSLPYTHPSLPSVTSILHSKQSKGGRRHRRRKHKSKKKHARRQRRRRQTKRQTKK